MNIAEFQTMMSKIYAMFTKTKPNNEILLNIFERVETIPAEAIPAILSRFEELPELKPNINMAKMIRSFYAGKKEEKFFCGTCNNQGVFWGIQKSPNGGYTEFASLCPNCSGDKQKDPTYSELVRRNAMVMPPNYKGGLHKWAFKTYGIRLHRPQ